MSEIITDTSDPSGSLNLGRFTILSPVSQFKEFKNFVYFGEICEGVLWFTKNKLLAKEKTLLGQKYVDDNYSLESISNKWRDLLWDNIIIYLNF